MSSTEVSIDVDHPLAWRGVQELGRVLNYLSVSDRLPTVFMPVSPPVCLNGGPREHLSWMIESKTPEVESSKSEWLEGRLPEPVDQEHQPWRSHAPTDALTALRYEPNMQSTAGSACTPPNFDTPGCGPVDGVGFPPCA